MSRRVVTHLHHLQAGDGHVAVECPRCGRAAAFSIGDLAAHCKIVGCTDHWDHVRTLFRCTACKHRPARVFLSSAALPLRHARPRTLDVPPGIDARAWHRADWYGQRRLIREARNR